MQPVPGKNNRGVPCKADPVERRTSTFAQGCTPQYGGLASLAPVRPGWPLSIDQMSYCSALLSVYAADQNIRYCSDLLSMQAGQFMAAKSTALIQVCCHCCRLPKYNPGGFPPLTVQGFPVILLSIRWHPMTARSASSLHLC